MDQSCATVILRVTFLNLSGLLRFRTLSLDEILALR